MKSCRSLAVLSLAVLLGWCRMSEAASIGVSASPLREVYHPREPLELQLSIRNTGQQDTSLLLGYPMGVGVQFDCKDVDAVPSSELRWLGRMPIVSLKAGENLMWLIALNRYLSLTRPKSYMIDFLAGYVEPIGKQNLNPTTFTAKGQFVVHVVPWCRS